MTAAQTSQYTRDWVIAARVSVSAAAAAVARLHVPCPRPVLPQASFVPESASEDAGPDNAFSSEISGACLVAEVTLGFCVKKKLQI